MKKINFLFLSLIFLVFTSCNVQMPVSKEYLAKPSRVGVYINSNPAQKYREGAQGLLDLALTSGDKYTPLLKIAEENYDPKVEMEQMYSDILSSKGKEVVLISEKFDPKTAPKFKGEKVEGKKYFNYDFRDLKSKYNVDEIIFVNLMWGVQVSYYSMIETGRSGFANFDTKIVNLDDNSLYLSNTNVQLVPIKGKWNTPPNYEIAEKAIKEALDRGLEKEKTILNP